MTHYTSPFTGNTSYTSDCELFSSMSKEAVQTFEQSDIESKLDLDRSSALFWSFSGECKIASEYLHDWGKAGVLRREYEKDNKKGNYCPLKVRKGAFNVFKEYLEARGYTVGNEYR